jgi:hypothetical protein
VARKPGHRGEHEVSRKTTAQGKPECFRFTCGPTPVLLVARGPRVQSAPGFPCALCFQERAGSDPRLGRIAPREGECTSTLRHCEERSDEAIHASARGGVDCFVSLAMTAESGRVGKAQRAHHRERSVEWWARRKRAFAHPTIVTRPEAAAGSGCCIPPPSPPRPPASAPSCCEGPRTIHRAFGSATPRTAPSRSGPTC